MYTVPFSNAPVTVRVTEFLRKYASSAAGLDLSSLDYPPVDQLRSTIARCSSNLQFLSLAYTAGLPSVIQTIGMC